MEFLPAPRLLITFLKGKFILIVESNPPDTDSTLDASSVNSTARPSAQLAPSVAAGVEGSSTEAGDLMDLDTKADAEKSDVMDTS